MNRQQRSFNDGNACERRAMQIDPATSAMHKGTIIQLRAGEWIPS